MNFLFGAIVLTTIVAVRCYTFPRFHLQQHRHLQHRATTGKATLTDEGYLQRIIDLICESYEAVMAPMKEPVAGNVVKTVPFGKPGSATDFDKHKAGGMFAEDSIIKRFEAKYINPSLSKPGSAPSSEPDARLKLAALLQDLQELDMLKSVEKHMKEKGTAKDVLTVLSKPIHGDIDDDAGVLHQLAEAIVDIH